MSSSNDKNIPIKKIMDDHFKHFKKQLLKDRHKTYIKAANKFGDISKKLDKLRDILEKIKKEISDLEAMQKRFEPTFETMQEQFKTLNEEGEDYVIDELRRENLESLNQAMIEEDILQVPRQAVIRHYANTYLDPLIEAYKAEEEYPESLTFGGKTKRRRRKKTTTRKRKRGKKNKK